MTRVGVAGLGYWGPNLARNFNDLTELGWICDQSPERLAELSARYPDPLHTVDHPFRIEIPERPRQKRLVTLFRLLLAVPVIVLGSVLSVVLSTVAIPAWFAGVIFGRNTAGLQELGTFCLRYQLEVQAYVLLVTPAYPRLAPPEVTTTEPA